MSRCAHATPIDSDIYSDFNKLRAKNKGRINNREKTVCVLM